MALSNLGSNEKLAVYGAVAVILGGLLGFGTRLGIVAIIAAVGMLIVVFLSHRSPPTRLPGSQGSLMLTFGGLAAFVLVLGLIGRVTSIGFMFANAAVLTLFYLVAVGGGVVMAWAGWRELRAEGGRFRLGRGTDANVATPQREDERPPAS